MSIKTLLITPPFSQLNTPYPATAYLKGFLDEKGVLVSQCDLSIELFSKVFTKDFIRKVFLQADNHKSYEYPLVWEQREEYIHKVEMVIKYLQHQEVTQAYQVLHNGFLPKGHRALNIEEDLSWAFGNLGLFVTFFNRKKQKSALENLFFSFFHDVKTDSKIMKV